MNKNKWIRKTHRVLSIVFTVTVIMNFVALALGEAPAWVVYLPLPPLLFLLLSGLYLFTLPYLNRSRRAEQSTA